MTNIPSTTFRVLQTCVLFQDIPAEELFTLLPYSLSLRKYAKSEVIAFEEDTCQAIGIVISGGVFVQRLYASGKTITIDTLGPGSNFGEVVIFSDQNSYPATLSAAEDTTLIFLSKEEVFRLCAVSPVFLRNFMALLSNKILMLNRKIKNLSYQSLRQKIIHLLWEEHRRQGQFTLHLSASRAEMAETLGVPRPSLSRELAAMKSEGLLDFDRQTITLIQPEQLKKHLE
jgi:CRP-like cAMP-binding protein